MNNYLFLVVLPKISCLLVILGSLGLIGSILYLCGCIMDTDYINSKEKPDPIWSFNKRIFFISAMFLFITVFIPGKKEFLQLKAISIISETKGINGIPQKLINKLNYLLDDDKENNDE